MNRKVDLDDFFLFHRAHMAEEILHSIERLERLKPRLDQDQQRALTEIIQRSRRTSFQAYLVPQLSPLEFLFLVTAIDLQKRLHDLEKQGWIHPPFP